MVLPLDLHSSRHVILVAEQEYSRVQVRAKELQQMGLHGMRRGLHVDIRVQRQDSEGGSLIDVVSY